MQNIEIVRAVQIERTNSCRMKFRDKNLMLVLHFLKLCIVRDLFLYTLYDELLFAESLDDCCRQNSLPMSREVSLFFLSRSSFLQ